MTSLIHRNDSFLTIIGITWRGKGEVANKKLRLVEESGVCILRTVSNQSSPSSYVNRMLHKVPNSHSSSPVHPPIPSVFSQVRLMLTFHNKCLKIPLSYSMLCKTPRVAKCTEVDCGIFGLLL